MTFEEKIRSRYQEESEHRVPKEAWSSFQAFREGPKKKSRRFIFFLLFFGLVLAPTLIFQQGRQEKNDLLLRVGARSATEAAFEANVNSAVPAARGKNAPTLSLQEIDLPEIQRPSQAQTSSVISPKIIEHLKEEGDPISYSSPNINQSKATTGNARDDAREILLAPAGLPTIESDFMVLDSRQIRGVSITAEPEQTLWSPGSHAVEGYAGLAVPFHMETANEQAHQFGFKYMRVLSPRIRMQVSAEYAQVTFKSTVFDRALGIAAVAAPSANYSFQDVILESSSANLFAGVDALVFSRGPWQGHLGMAYGAATELGRDADYAFVKQDGEEDFILSVSDSKRYFEPALLRFESGLYYQTQVGDFGVSFRCPWQFAKNQTQLLRQVQLNFGMTYRF